MCDDPRSGAAKLAHALVVCTNRRFPGGLRADRQEAVALNELLCMERLLPESTYRSVQSPQDLGEQVASDFGSGHLYAVFMQASYRREFLPPAWGNYRAWSSPCEGLPDVLLIDYVASGLHLRVVHTSRAWAVFLSQADLPLLKVPSVQRRDLVAATLRRLWYEGSGALEGDGPEGWLPAELEDGAAFPVGEAQRFEVPTQLWDLGGHLGVSDGRLYEASVKLDGNGGYGGNSTPVHWEEWRFATNEWFRRGP